MKIANLINGFCTACLAASILTFFATPAVAEDRKGPPHHRHGKPDAHHSVSSHGKSSSHSLRDRWNKMSDKERDEARKRMKESWAKRIREAKERQSRGGDRDHRGDHGKRDVQHAGSLHGKSAEHGKSHGKHGDHHDKSEGRKEHSSHGHSSIFSRMRDKWNGMSEKEKDTVRDRMRRAGEDWKEHLRERFSHHKSGGDHPEHQGKPECNHGKPPKAKHGEHRQGSSHAGKPPPHSGRPDSPHHGKPKCDRTKPPKGKHGKHRHCPSKAGKPSQHRKPPHTRTSEEHHRRPSGPPPHAGRVGKHGKPPHARPGGNHRGKVKPPHRAGHGGRLGNSPHARTGDHQRGRGRPPSHAWRGGRIGKPPFAGFSGRHGKPPHARPGCKNCGKHGSKRR